MDVKWKDASSAAPCEPHHIDSMLENLSKTSADGCPAYVVSGNTILVRHGDHIFEATLRRTGLIEPVKERYNVFYQVNGLPETFVTVEATDMDDAWDAARGFARSKGPSYRVNRVEKA